MTSTGMHLDFGGKVTSWVGGLKAETSAPLDSLKSQGNSDMGHVSSTTSTYDGHREQAQHTTLSTSVVTRS